MTSRRAILKSIAVIGLASIVRPDPLIAFARGQRQTLPLPRHWNGEPYARIAAEYQNFRAEPSIDAEISGQGYQDEIIRVRRAINGQTVFLYNDLWIETPRGYLYSSFVQPMWYHLPNPPADEAAIGAGRWAVVTAPYTDAYWDTVEAGREDPTFAGRMYYQSVHRVIRPVEGKDGRAWYYVEELYGGYYMRAAHLRLLTDDDLSPLSPDVPTEEKLIRINLDNQTMTAYEYDQPVFRHYVATGRAEQPTPSGTHFVVDKRISDRMTNRGTAAYEEIPYDLAAVPWVCYFTWEWAAFHGCYWHNDFGQRRSAGCVNLPPEAARWVWRWTTPHPPLDEFYYRPASAYEGTRVVVTGGEPQE